VKHINCNTCGTELTDNNWSTSWKEVNRKQCTKCSKNYNDDSNKNRMFVNGKYIPQSHPLYKAGNYQTFEDAAFSSLSRYTTSSEGEVYIITNPAWKGWIKIGMAIDSEDRCKGYQTSSPLRDFKLKFKKYFDDRRIAEQTAHSLCAKKADKRKGEWFKLDVKIAKDIINNMEVV
tara:strand:- start:880 stop:1404 length:525 start_codon:yes stop_codon:yes gene_type:complete